MPDFTVFHIQSVPKVCLPLDVTDRKVHHLLMITFADLTGGDLGKESHSWQAYSLIASHMREIIILKVCALTLILHFAGILMWIVGYEIL